MNAPTPDSNQKFNFSRTSIIIAILAGAWIIGMSILAAGWLITREIARQNPTATDIANQRTEIEVPAGMDVLGDNNASVTVIEFADFQCPFCGEWHKTIFPELKSKYIDTGKVRFVYMDFPFLGPESYRATEAARCAMDQNKFWQYHDELYANQVGENEGAFADSKLKGFAKNIGLDTVQFNECLDSKKYQSAAEASLQKGSDYGVASTPTVYINGLKVEGLLPADSYWQIIESELAK